MNNLPFNITEDDVKRYRDKQAKSGIDNHPIRDVDKTTFFQALMSDEADFIKHGSVSKEAVMLLGEGKDC